MDPELATLMEDTEHLKINVTPTHGVSTTSFDSNFETKANLITPLP
jgi:hypothetical protein